MRDNCEIFDTKKSLEQHFFQKHLFGKKNLSIRSGKHLFREFYFTNVFELFELGCLVSR